MISTDKILLDLLKKNLDSLERATLWVFLTLLIIFFSNIRKESEFEIANIKIDKKHSGIVLYGLLCCLNFQVLHLVQNVSYILGCVSNKSLACLVLKLHPWIFNPFSETENITGHISNNLGFLLLLILWWFGFSIAEGLFVKKSSKIEVVGTIMFGIYLVLGTLCLIHIIEIIYNYNFRKIKIIYTLLGAIISYILSFQLIKLLKNFHN